MAKDAPSPGWRPSCPAGGQVQRVCPHALPSSRGIPCPRPTQASPLPFQQPNQVLLQRKMGVELWGCGSTTAAPCALGVSAGRLLQLGHGFQSWGWASLQGRAPQPAREPPKAPLGSPRGALRKRHLLGPAWRERAGRGPRAIDPVQPWKLPSLLW